MGSSTVEGTKRTPGFWLKTGSRIIEWAGTTESGDRADVPGFFLIFVRGDDLEAAGEILDEYHEEESGRAIVGDDENEEWAGASRRRVKVLIGVTIMVVIVVYFALNSIDMF